MGAIRMAADLCHADDLLSDLGNHEPRPGHVSGVEPGLPNQGRYGRLVVLTCLANGNPHTVSMVPSVRGPSGPGGDNRTLTVAEAAG